MVDARMVVLEGQTVVDLALVRQVWVVEAVVVDSQEEVAYKQPRDTL